MTFRTQPTSTLSKELFGSSKKSATTPRKARQKASPGWTGSQKTRRYNGHSRGLSAEYAAGIPTLDDQHVRFLADRHDEEPSPGMKSAMRDRIEAAKAEIRSRHLEEKGGNHVEAEQDEWA
jgi:hypothetical protein